MEPTRSEEIRQILAREDQGFSTGRRTPCLRGPVNELAQTATLTPEEDSKRAPEKKTALAQRSMASNIRATTHHPPSKESGHLIRGGAHGGTPCIRKTEAETRNQKKSCLTH